MFAHLSGLVLYHQTEVIPFLSRVNLGLGERLFKLRGGPSKQTLVCLKTGVFQVYSHSVGIRCERDPTEL